MSGARQAAHGKQVYSIGTPCSTGRGHVVGIAPDVATVVSRSLHAGHHHDRYRGGIAEDRGGFAGVGEQFVLVADLVLQDLTAWRLVRQQRSAPVSEVA